jgi:hypothetical protein
MVALESAARAIFRAVVGRSFAPVSAKRIFQARLAARNSVAAARMGLGRDAQAAVCDRPQRVKIGGADQSLRRAATTGLSTFESQSRKADIHFSSFSLPQPRGSSVAAGSDTGIASLTSAREVCSALAPAMLRMKRNSPWPT